MRDSEYTANEQMASALNSALLVIENSYLHRCAVNDRNERRRVVGARAIGLIEALIHTGDMPEFAKERARELIQEWER